MTKEEGYAAVRDHRASTVTPPTAEDVYTDRAMSCMALLDSLEEYLTSLRAPDDGEVYTWGDVDTITPLYERLVGICEAIGLTEDHHHEL